MTAGHTGPAPFINLVKSLMPQLGVFIALPLGATILMVNSHHRRTQSSQKPQTAAT